MDSSLVGRSDYTSTNTIFTHDTSYFMTSRQCGFHMAPGYLATIIYIRPDNAAYTISTYYFAVCNRASFDGATVINPGYSTID